MRQTFYEFCMLHERTNLLKEWDESRNFPLTPDTVSYGSKKKVWWTCENGHSWQTTVHVRSEGSGCPYCTGRKVLPGFNDLGTLYPDVAAQWDREKNGSLSPRDVSTGSKIRIWWRCPEGHSWQSPVASRTAWGHGCPVCAGKTIVTGENDLAHLQPEIAAQWDKRKNGCLKPSDVAVSSNRPAWWRCELGHSYRATVSSRTQRKTGCPYCAGRKVLKGFNDLKTLCPGVAAQWHPSLNGALTPEMVTPGSNKKVWWQCSMGHVWKSVIYPRTGAQQCGCPVCAGKVSTTHARRYAQLDEIRTFTEL